MPFFINLSAKCTGLVQLQQIEESYLETGCDRFEIQTEGKKQNFFDFDMVALLY
jgi:hypothetical protein